MRLGLIFIKVAAWADITVSKKILRHVFFCEFGGFFENTSFKEHFRVTASIVITWNTKLLSFSFFILAFPIFIDLSVHLAYVFVLLIEGYV